MKLRTTLLACAAAALTGVLAAQAQVPGVNSTLNAVFTLAYDNSTMKQTYSASVANLSAPSGGGDICSIYGSATKNIRVRRVIFAGIAPSLGTDPISILKRSTQAQGGTLAAVAMTSVPYDSANAAATAMTDIYTAAPTPGTLVGILADVYVTLAGATTSVAQSQPYTFEFGRLGQPIVLRGVSEGVHVNDSTLAGITVSCTFEWTEE